MLRLTLMFAILILTAACSGSTGDEDTAAETSTSQTSPGTTALPTTTVPPASTSSTSAPTASDEELIALGHDFMAAFASFDADGLDDSAPSADLTEVKYFQRYGEFLNYAIVGDIGCEVVSSRVDCTFANEDDMTRALSFQPTDTWSFVTNNGEIVRVQTDNTDELSALFGWISENKPEYFDGVCAGYAQDIDTAVACAMETLAATYEFVEATS